MPIEVQIVNAFVDGDDGGNPAGVVVDANALTPEQKQKVARAAGLSETAFVSKSDSATLKLEFFTPTQQIAHCGHATVATFSLLRQLGIVGEGRHTKETIDGIRDIVVEADMAFMEQRAPAYTTLARDGEYFSRALHSLGIADEQLMEGLAPCVVNTGNSFLLIPLQDEAAVKAIQPDLPAIAAVSQALDLVGYYVFSRQTKHPGRSAGARMFAPHYGIAEEAGTGMAAGPLACYLHDVLQLRETNHLIEQGWLMPSPSPSVIQVDLHIENQSIGHLMAGGRAKSVGALQLEV